MDSIETTTLNDQTVLRHIRNTASWILGQEINTGKIWANTLLGACEYLERRLQFNEVVINNPGKVIINRDEPEMDLDFID